MSVRPVLPEWSGDKLVYVSPRETLNRFGYTSVSQRDDVTSEEIELSSQIAAKVPLQDGEVAARRRNLGVADATAWVTSRARQLGADMVGITKVDPFYVYDGFDLSNDFAVVVAIAMDYEGEVLQVPRKESHVEYLRVYEALSRLTVQLAAEIRAAGFPARAHSVRDEQLAMLPHAHRAGLGELGKHGSLINRELGCSFRVGVVTTELTLAEDQPLDEGIEDFCSGCRMCTTYCPGDAISGERAVVRDTERWIVDTERCAPFFAAHYACAVCLQVCPINAKAFGGQFRDAYVRKMKELDPTELGERLSADIPAPSPR